MRNANVTSPTSPVAARHLIALAMLCIPIASCTETQKPDDNRAANLTAALHKEGPSIAVVAGELSTAMASGKAEDGTSSIGPGQSLQGRLEATDATFEEGGYFDSWVFVVDAASDVSIGVSSDDFDTFVSLHEGGLGEYGTYLGADDDGGSDLDSYLQIRLEPGTYTAMVSSFLTESTGTYMISLEVAGPGSTRTVGAGQEVSGTLTPADPTMLDGQPYQDWTLNGDVGDQVTIDLMSTDFDPYLYVLRNNEVVASNDDFEFGLDSRVVLTLSQPGAYTIRASSFGADATGDYTLSVQPGGGPPQFAGFGTGGDPNGRYALLVGIDDYPGFDNDLRGPVEDARIMERVLIEKYGFDPANIVTLNDANATRQNIAQGVAQHLGQAGPDGVAVFFYSGHGTQIGQNIGLTGDLDPEPRGDGDEAIYVYGDEFASSVVLDEELGYLIETIDAGRALVVVDACFSGEITRAAGDAPQSKNINLSDPAVAASTRLPTSLITSELKALELTDMSLGFGDFSQMVSAFENPQRHVSWGGSTEDQVSWTSGLGNGASVFTYYIGQHMMEAPGSMTFAQLNALVHDDVVDYINDNGNMTMQNPQMQGANQSMTLDDFFRQR